MASRLPSLSLNQEDLCPGASLTGIVPFDADDPVDRLESRHVVFLKDRAALAKLRDCPLEVAGLPRHLGVISGSGSGEFEEGELAVTTPVTKPSRPLLDGLQTQLQGIKRPGPESWNRAPLERQSTNHLL